MERFSELGVRPGVQVTLDGLLRLYRQNNAHPQEELHICVKRCDLLQGALEAAVRPNFCFRKTPVISFRGEETDGSQPIREFFRYRLPFACNKKSINPNKFVFLFSSRSGWSWWACRRVHSSRVFPGVCC